MNHLDSNSQPQRPVHASDRWQTRPPESCRAVVERYEVVTVHASHHPRCRHSHDFVWIS